MCYVNNDCEYEGIMLEAIGDKDVYLYCNETNMEYRIPHRLKVLVCPECGEVDWMTLS